MKELWDPVRSQFVIATPEEQVRQRWIQAMIESLGYPKGLLSVEKSIKKLSQTKSSRRVDIVCFTPGRTGLKALLIVECKAEDEGQRPESQVEGYNFSIQAPFLCVIQGNSAKTYWIEKDQLCFVPFLPKYSDLIKAI